MEVEQDTMEHWETAQDTMNPAARRQDAHSVANFVRWKVPHQTSVVVTGIPAVAADQA
jgi:hypothetical protein